MGGWVKGWGGRGRGEDDAGLAKKGAVVGAGLTRQADGLHDPLFVLQALGGREIAAMAGSIAAARAHGIPVLSDRCICSSAALGLHALNPPGLEHTQARYQSHDAAHARFLEQRGQ